MSLATVLIDQHHFAIIRTPRYSFKMLLTVVLTRMEDPQQVRRTALVAFRK